MKADTGNYFPHVKGNWVKGVSTQDTCYNTSLLHLLNISYLPGKTFALNNAFAFYAVNKLNLCFWTVLNTQSWLFAYICWLLDFGFCNIFVSNSVNRTVISLSSLDNLIKSHSSAGPFINLWTVLWFIHNHNLPFDLHAKAFKHI